jgi:hypothetical protein
VRVETGTYDFGRLLLAASPKIGKGNLLAAFETSTNSGPWTVPDSYKTFNGVVRYSQGDNVNGLSLTFMGYHGEWNATEASPQRAIDSGLIDRFGSIDPTDGGHTYRYSVGGEWQHGSGQTLSKIQAYGLGYDLGLISNFTFFLDDPVRGDQREQVDHRFVSGVRAFQKRQTRWGGRPVENTFGVQFRNDDVMQVALYHTEARQRLETWNDASAIVSSLGVYGENLSLLPREACAWPALRSRAGSTAGSVEATILARLRKHRRSLPSLLMTLSRACVSRGRSRSQHRSPSMAYFLSGCPLVNRSGWWQLFPMAPFDN